MESERTSVERRDTFWVSRNPSLAGSLAIFNLLSWAALFLLGDALHPASVPSWLRALFPIWMGLLSLSLAYVYLILPMPTHATEVICQCVVLGVNALLWGYYVALLLRLSFLRRFFPRTGPGEMPSE